VNKTLKERICTQEHMPATSGEIWASAQQQLRTMLSADIYNLWFAPIRARGIEGDLLTLEVANDFCEVWLQENYMDVLQRVVAEVSGQPLRIQFRLHGACAAPKVRPDGEALKPRRKDEAEPAATREPVFNPRNTFDNFVVGSNNTFAHAASMAVAQNPGKAYNPLFVYSGVGLGKTHLLHAIGQYVVHHKKGARVTYVSCEKFTNEFIDAIQNNQLVRFRKRYRLTDVFLIDDVQFLAGKERIQEEFFHTFNTLHEAHKQIVLTCDRPPGEIQNLEQRLVSRFEWGLTTDIQAPDVETRLAILRQKAQLMAVEVPDEVIDFLAHRIRTNIRRLEGALVRVTSYQSLVGKKLTIEGIEHLLREILHEEGRHTITIETIQKRVAEQYDIRLADMSSKRRPEHIAFPRQVAMYLARTLTESSLSTIGEAFGGRDHGTVLHACRLVKDRMQVDSNVRQKVHYLEKQLLR
jgi:chromosomal replication initiator protein